MKMMLREERLSNKGENEMKEKTLQFTLIGFNHRYRIEECR